MRRHAWKRWLMSCALGTVGSLAGTLSAPNAAWSTPPAQSASPGPSAFILPSSQPATPPIYVAPSQLIAPTGGTAPLPVGPILSPRAKVVFESTTTEPALPGINVPINVPEEGMVIPLTHMPPGSPYANLQTPGAGATLGTPKAGQAQPTVPQGIGLDPVATESPTHEVGLQVMFPRAEKNPDRKAYVDLSAAPCFAYASDYKWIVGRVEYSSIAKEWRLRYTSVDDVDRYGGRVVLVENQHVGYLTDGMYVHVRGHLVNPDATGHKPAYYRIEWFQTVKNPNQPVAITNETTPSAPSTTPVSKTTPMPALPAAAVLPPAPNTAAPVLPGLTAPPTAPIESVPLPPLPPLPSAVPLPN